MQEQPKKKILLVEDDVALAAVYRSRLELEEFETREVNNGEDALQAAKEFQPDLILLDAMMPKISGFDVLDILRNTPETANIRVIMLTALSQPKDKERAESLGVDDYLVKSQVVIGDVVERVRHHLGIGQGGAAAPVAAAASIAPNPVAPASNPAVDTPAPVAPVQPMPSPIPVDPVVASAPVAPVAPLPAPDPIASSDEPSELPVSDENTTATPQQPSVQGMPPTPPVPPVA